MFVGSPWFIRLSPPKKNRHLQGLPAMSDSLAAAPVQVSAVATTAPVRVATCDTSRLGGTTLIGFQVPSWNLQNPKFEPIWSAKFDS
jgi:hypothetical protein